MQKLDAYSILMISPHQYVLKLVQDILYQVGVKRVFSAVSVDEGFVKATNILPDVIIVDQDLGKDDCFALIKLLKDHKLHIDQQIEQKRREYKLGGKGIKSDLMAEFADDLDTDVSFPDFPYLIIANEVTLDFAKRAKEFKTNNILLKPLRPVDLKSRLINIFSQV